MWEHIYVEELDDIEKIQNYEVCIVGAWVPPYNLLVPRLKPRVWWLITSPLLQMELGGVEWPFLHQILSNDKVEKVWFGDKGLEKVFPEKGIHLPYPVHLETFLNYPRPLCETKKDIGLFTALSNPQKNIMVQLAAIKLVQNETTVELHVNGLPPLYRSFADKIGLKYVDHGWLQPQDYLSLLSKLRVQTHVFLSESFSYATLESMMLGTPCIVSPCVSRIIDAGIVVSSVDEPSEIAECVLDLLSMHAEDYRVCCETQRKRALQLAEENNYLIRVTLKKYL